MPVHDWPRVDAGIFHDFHQTWIIAMKTALNDGILPPGYYALAEQVVGRLGPDVLTLQRPASPTRTPPRGGTLTLESAPPRTKYRLHGDEVYAQKANRVAIRHLSDHSVIALIEVVSPGNKASKHGLQAFLRKAEEALAGGVNLVVLDVLPPGPRDPEGLHPLVWEDRGKPIYPAEATFAFHAEKPLTLMSYVASPGREAFIEPIAVGDELPPMPLFLTPDEYVPVPLAPTYEAAWRALPEFWRDILLAREPTP